MSKAKAVSKPVIENDVDASPSVATSMLANTLHKLLTAASRWREGKGWQPHLAGVLLEHDGTTLHIVSTNGVGMFVAEMPSVASAFRFWLSAADVVDVLDLTRRAKPMSERRGALPPMSVDIEAYAACLSVGNPRAELTLRAQHDAFPNWRRVVPKNSVERAAMIGLSPRLLQRAAQSFDEGELRVTVRGSLDPVTLHGKTAGVPSFVVVMPMHIGTHIKESGK